jgi:hypothetical protein
VHARLGEKIKIRHCCKCDAANGGAARSKGHCADPGTGDLAAPAKGEENTRDVSTMGWFFLNRHGARLWTVLIESRIVFL